MVETLLFLGGVLIGCIITHFINHVKEGRGYFMIDASDKGDYTIRIHIPEGQPLSKKKHIRLIKTEF